MRAVSSAEKNSASRTGVASSVDTTMKVVRRSESRRVTASARSTKPAYIDWNRMKNSEMSARNCVPRMRSATW